MAQPVIQASFNTGEWAPALNARVDMQKYHSAAALLENFFVDYRGGASTRAGTKYILQAYKSATAVRLIPFQASFSVGYVLEFGDRYIRFYNNGAPVLEAGLAITGVTQANPAVVSVVNTYSVGDWVFISGVAGMTQLNGNYYSITARSAGSITLADLNGVPINSTGFGAYVSGGTTARVYTLASPYAAADLAKIKFAQEVSTLVLCHPSYQPYLLTLITATNWTLVPIVFGSTVQAPGGVNSSTTLTAGTVNYSYLVTAVDANGQESAPSTPTALANLTDIRTVPGSNYIFWNAVANAQSYNVYKAEPAYSVAVPAGAAYGFIGNCTGTLFTDSNIGQDFAQSPPIPQNPFQGAGVASITVTAAGVYTTVPTVTLSNAPAGGSNATAAAVLGALTIAPVFNEPNGAGLLYNIGDAVTFTGGVTAVVATISSDGNQSIVTFQPLTFPGSNLGNITAGATPTNPVAQTSTTGGGLGATANVTWGVRLVNLVTPGAGYGVAPTVTFSSGAAAATSALGPASFGNPSVPGFFQQRLVLAAPPMGTQTIYMSQPGSYYNFNISQLSEEDDAITASLISGQLSSIKSMVPQPSGLLVLSDKTCWLINGGSFGSAVTASAIVANPQAFVGSSDLPPIVANYDVLFGQSKGSIVRDASYNFYANVFVGTDISILASHLFYGYTLLEWAWVEEPFKTVWAVRNDGALLTLTFLKEQEFTGWTHSVTQGLYKSVATITEAVASGNVDALYTIAQRVINGNTVQYIERFAERIFPNGATDAWCVDAGIQYNGAATTAFMGAQHLAGATVTGLADGVVIPPFVMPTTGAFTLGTAASKVTIGLGFTCDLQTLAIDLGEPTVQGKVKKIPAVTVRVADTLGLSIGSSFTSLVPMKDLVVGNVGSMLTGQPSQVVTGLYTGDARTFLDPTYTVPGQYCIRQALPLPASVLGVIPQITVGDTAK